MTTSPLEITATRMLPVRRSWMTDELVRMCVVAFGTLSVALGLAFNYYAHPFPWLGAGLLVVIAAATRVFGIPLPGKGFASFAVGPGVAALIALDWAAGALVVALGIIVGDAIVRRLPMRNAISNAGHFLTAGTIAGYAYYGLMSGQLGLAAFTQGNAWRLGFMIALFLITVNGTFTCSSSSRRRSHGSMRVSPRGGRVPSPCSRRSLHSARSDSPTARRRRAR